MGATPSNWQTFGVARSSFTMSLYTSAEAELGTMWHSNLFVSLFQALARYKYLISSASCPKLIFSLISVGVDDPLEFTFGTTGDHLLAYYVRSLISAAYFSGFDWYLV